MAADFVGRRKELEFLGRTLRSDKSEFIPVYGRRRVGKSELILHFIQDKPAIYHLGKEAPPGLQIREFLRVSAQVLDEPLLADLAVDDWATALKTVVNRWKGPGKLVVVMDEFQWTASASPELPSVLQDCWDRRWQRSGKLVLILCGSYVGFMEREVLGKKSPLFGRRTGQIQLQPFGFREAAEFHPSYSLVDQARTYFICGGVPLYLRCFDQRRSFELNLMSSILDEYAPLHREPDFLLREELRDVENYYAVLTAISADKTSAADIAAYASVPERSLHYYLNQLVELGYVQRRYPLSGKKPTARQVRFTLDDPLLRFWFRFIFPHLSYLRQMGSKQAFKDRIRPNLDAYLGGCFERMCREALQQLYYDEGIAAGFEIGEYWDKATQIDVVGLRDDGWTDLGECKWGEVRSPKKIAGELESRIGHFPNDRNATIGRCIFTRKAMKPPKSVDPSIRWYSLQDMYGR